MSSACASSCSSSPWLHAVDSTRSANPMERSTRSTPGVAPKASSGRKKRSMLWRNMTSNDSVSPSRSAIDVSFARTSSRPVGSASIALGPMFALNSETAASPTRAAAAPMTRMSWSATSSPRNSIAMTRTPKISMSRRVNTLMPGSGSGNPAARQNFRSSAGSVPDIAAASSNVNRSRSPHNRLLVATSMRLAGPAATSSSRVAPRSRRYSMRASCVAASGAAGS